MFLLRYVIRNIVRRRRQAFVTVFGVAVAIGLYVAIGSVGAAMVHGFNTTGEPQDVVLVQAGSISTDFSRIQRASLSYLQTCDGVALVDGRPAVSPELYVHSAVELAGASRSVAVRGVGDMAQAIYTQVRVDGAWPSSGAITAAVGQAFAERYGLAVGDSLPIEGGTFTVSGILRTGGRVYDQEVWVSLDDLAAHTQRADYSCFTVRTISPEAAGVLAAEVNGARRFPLQASPAPAHYAKAGGMAMVLAALGRFISFVIVLGAMFGGMNALFATVANRVREIGVLRALGYQRTAVLALVLVESLVLSLVGGIIGVGLGACVGFVPVDVPYMVANHVQLAYPMVAHALSLAVFVGLVGGGFPAWHAAHIRVVEALQ